MKAVFSNIFLTVGFAHQDFSRLIRKTDELTPTLGAKVVMQIGHSRYQPRYADYFRFASSVIEYIKNADLVISHGGVTIIDAVRAHKPVIVVPRQAEYEEHFNSHQVEFAAAVARHPAIKVVYEVDDLPEAINYLACNATNIQFDDSNRLRLVKKLQDFVCSQA